MNIFDIFVVQPIFNLLITLYALIPGGDFGVALILFTIIVRLLMWPLVKKQLHQVKVMQKIQPELAKIKKNAKGNRQLESMQMLELYKRHDVNPFRSIGVLMIQLPVFIALYRVIVMFTSNRKEVARYTYDFLESLTPIHNIIVDPSQFKERLFGLIDLTSVAISPKGVNIILLLLAVAAAYSQRIMSRQTMPKQQAKKSLKEIMTEAADGKQANQSDINSAVMGKMTTFMPFMMFFIMINLPGALALYYAVSNMVAVYQQGRVLKQDVEELEEIADEEPKVAKKATAKAREKAAKEANVTRIIAKDTPRGKAKR